MWNCGAEPMRVIAGKFKSRRLAAPPGTATRPTSDRLRETLFNVVAPAVPDSVWLDLFAGSGAIGIAALSLGGLGCCDKVTRGSVFPAGNTRPPQAGRRLRRDAPGGSCGIAAIHACFPQQP